MVELTSDGVRFNDYTTQTSAENEYFRNLIINGDMSVAQRGASFPAIANSYYTLDRWLIPNNTSAVATVTQNLDAPSGFTYSLRHTITTADTSIASGDIATIEQKIEGYTASELIGNTFTVSFWVRSSKTGTHTVCISNAGYYIKEYTINVANTWEYKSFTVVGGLPNAYAWGTTNNIGCILTFSLAAGSGYHGSPNAWTSSFGISTANQVNCLDTVGNIFAITGVQVEKAPGATSFGFRTYELEALLCQRYYSLTAASARRNAPGASQTVITPLYWPVVMRANPTVSFISSGTADLNVTSKSAINITPYGAGFAVVNGTATDVYAVYQTAAADAEL